MKEQFSAFRLGVDIGISTAMIGFGSAILITAVVNHVDWHDLKLSLLVWGLGSLMFGFLIFIRLRRVKPEDSLRVMKFATGTAVLFIIFAGLLSRV